MTDNNMNMPSDAMFNLYGEYYKVGVHNKILRWDGIEWILSPKNNDDVVFDLNRSVTQKNKDCRLINDFYRNQLKAEKAK